MSPGASYPGVPPGRPHRRGETAWAWIIAILFLALAAISFAVDQSVTLSSLPKPPLGHHTVR